MAGYKILTLQLFPFEYIKSWSIAAGKSEVNWFLPLCNDLSFLSRSFGILLLSLAFLIIIILYLEVQFFCYSLSLFLWELSIWGLPCFFNSRNFIFMFSSFLKNFLYFRDFYSLDVDNRTLYTPLFEFYVIYHFRL